MFLIVAIWIKLDDRKGPVFYRQKRVGKEGLDFKLYKFRSMSVASDKKGLITTISGCYPRITSSGLVETNFSNIRMHGDKASAKKLYTGVEPLTGADIADVVFYAASAPSHVSISEVTIHATNQASPLMVYRK